MTTATDTTAQRYLAGYASASRFAGMSTQTLRRLVADGFVKTYRPTGGRLVLFDRAELDAAIRASVEPHDDSSSEQG